MILIILIAVIFILGLVGVTVLKEDTLVHTLSQVVCLIWLAILVLVVLLIPITKSNNKDRIETYEKTVKYIELLDSSTKEIETQDIYELNQEIDIINQSLMGNKKFRNMWFSVYYSKDLDKLEILPYYGRK